MYVFLYYVFSVVYLDPIPSKFSLSFFFSCLTSISATLPHSTSHSVSTFYSITFIHYPYDTSNINPYVPRIGLIIWLANLVASGLERPRHTPVWYLGYISPVLLTCPAHLFICSPVYLSPATLFWAFLYPPWPLVPSPIRSYYQRLLPISPSVTLSFCIIV